MEIEIWNNVQMQQHLDKKRYNYSTYLSDNRRNIFTGFNYFHPDWIHDRPDTENSNRNLSDLKLNDRHIVSLEDDHLIGLFSLMFCRGTYDFDQYYPRILEVRKDKRNQGIATKLVQRLKEPCFLHGKVLMIRNVAGHSSYTLDGKKYLQHVIERELKDVPFQIVDGSLTRLIDYSILVKKNN